MQPQVRMYEAGMPQVGQPQGQHQVPEDQQEEAPIRARVCSCITKL